MGLASESTFRAIRLPIKFPLANRFEQISICGTKNGELLCLFLCDVLSLASYRNGKGKYEMRFFPSHKECECFLIRLAHLPSLFQKMEKGTHTKHKFPQCLLLLLLPLIFCSALLFHSSWILLRISKILALVNFSCCRVRWLNRTLWPHGKSCKKVFCNVLSMHTHKTYSNRQGRRR